MQGCFRSIGISAFSGKSICLLNGCFCPFLYLIVLLVRHATILELLLQAVNRIILAQAIDLVLRTVGFGIALKVTKITVGTNFNQRRSCAAPGTGNSLADDIAR